ncbi:hypothetical protein K1719_042874 [Acacia pycnantha]|nr:hypothetical protein K1719_042874 [Acacia pycnantha]
MSHSQPNSLLSPTRVLALAGDLSPPLMVYKPHFGKEISVEIKIKDGNVSKTLLREVSDHILISSRNFMVVTDDELGI